MKCGRCKKGQRERGGIYLCNRYQNRYPDAHGFAPSSCPIFDDVGIKQNTANRIENLKMELRSLKNQRSDIISEIYSLEDELSEKESEKDEITKEIDEIEDEIRDIEAEIKESKSDDEN